MILTGPTIRNLAILDPHVARGVAHGMSYGEGLAGYDIRLGEAVHLIAGRTTLGVSMERFAMPRDVLGRVCDKSTLIRQGVRVGTTVIEPGWCGYLTIELVWFPLNSSRYMIIEAGTPIAQVIFERIECETAGYAGKYQDQPAQPVRAMMEEA